MTLPDDPAWRGLFRQVVDEEARTWRYDLFELDGTWREDPSLIGYLSGDTGAQPLTDDEAREIMADLAA